MKTKGVFLLLMMVLVMLLSVACVTADTLDTTDTADTADSADIADTADTADTVEMTNQVTEVRNRDAEGSVTVAADAEDMETMKMQIGETAVDVTWEENDSVKELKELAASGLTIRMSMYGGFEQVGAIGQSITNDDKQTLTAPGDIVLYSGNQLVVFYGSNSWAYTRLGKINMKKKELKELLGNGDVTITLSTE